MSVSQSVTEPRLGILRPCHTSTPTYLRPEFQQHAALCVRSFSRVPLLPDQPPPQPHHTHTHPHRHLQMHLENSCLLQAPPVLPSPCLHLWESPVPGSGPSAGQRPTKLFPSCQTRPTFALDYRDYTEPSTGHRQDSHQRLRHRSAWLSLCSVHQPPLRAAGTLWAQTGGDTGLVFSVTAPSTGTPMHRTAADSPHRHTLAAWGP